MPKTQFDTIAYSEDENAHILRCQKRAQVIFSEGCYQGDIARAPLAELDTTDREVLNAINETVLAMAHNALDTETIVGASR